VVSDLIIVGDRLVARGREHLELGRRDVAQGLVEPVGIESAEVLDDGELELDRHDARASVDHVVRCWPRDEQRPLTTVDSRVSVNALCP